MISYCWKWNKSFNANGAIQNCNIMIGMMIILADTTFGITWHLYLFGLSLSFKTYCSRHYNLDDVGFLGSIYIVRMIGQSRKLSLPCVPERTRWRTIHSSQGWIGNKCTYRSTHHPWYLPEVRSTQPTPSTLAPSTRRILKESRFVTFLTNEY